jgi:N-acetylmuramoyl-L-alanine amidase
MKICIDPGHGMSNRTFGVFDPGATHQENTFLFKEADLALRYALTLKDAFRAKGFDVFMTRDDATDHTPVGTRAAMAKSANCDLFISLHLNDFDDDSANGFEVLYGANTSRPLAQSLQTALVSLTGMRDRGIKKRTDLAVLKFDGPAVLIELGFIANDGDREKLLNAQIRDSLTRKIVEVTGAFLAQG